MNCLRLTACSTPTAHHSTPHPSPVQSQYALSLFLRRAAPRRAVRSRPLYSLVHSTRTTPNAHVQVDVPYLYSYCTLRAQRVSVFGGCGRGLASASHQFNGAFAMRVSSRLFSSCLVLHVHCTRGARAARWPVTVTLLGCGSALLYSAHSAIPMSTACACARGSAISSQQSAQLVSCRVVAVHTLRLARRVPSAVCRAEPKAFVRYLLRSAPL